MSKGLKKLTAFVTSSVMVLSAVPTITTAFNDYGAKIVVKYLDNKGNAMVDPQGNPTETVYFKNIGDQYELTPRDFYGYTLINTSGQTSGTVNSNLIEVFTNRSTERQIGNI